MSEGHGWIDVFIASLQSLGPASLPALARLRRDNALTHAGWLFGDVPDDALGNAVLVTNLFAGYPAPGSGTLGEGFRRLHETQGDNAEKRLANLLDSDSEDLPHKLRHAVKLFRTRNITIDWADLLRHLVEWDSESRWVQKRLADDFWRG